MPDKLQVLNVTSMASWECEEESNAHKSHLCTMSKFRTGACNVSSFAIMTFT